MDFKFRVERRVQASKKPEERLSPPLPPRSPCLGFRVLTAQVENFLLMSSKVTRHRSNPKKRAGLPVLEDDPNPSPGLNHT